MPSMQSTSKTSGMKFSHTFYFLVLLLDATKRSTSLVPSASWCPLSTTQIVPHHVPIRTCFHDGVNLDDESKRLTTTIYRRLTIYHRSRHSSWPLSMGLRKGILSILGKRRKNKDNNQDLNEEEEDDESPIEIESVDSSNHEEDAKEHSILSKIKGQGTGESGSSSSDEIKPALKVGIPAIDRGSVQMGANTETSDLRTRLSEGESVQERINRVKAGKMTAEEKESFLETALSAGSTVDKRRPFIHSSEEKARRGHAAPFPTDSIYRNLARGSKGSNRDDSAETSEQKKKREYLDMITNPARFDLYKSYASAPSRAPPAPSKPLAPSELDDTPYSLEKRQKQVDRRRTTTSAAKQNPIAQTSITPLDVSSLNDPQSESSLTDSLGDRLGAAALADESSKRQMQEITSTQERRGNPMLQADVYRSDVLARPSHVEMARREAEARRKKRQADEQNVKAKEEEEAQEKNQLDAMMKAQQDYWAQKLASEKAAAKAPVANRPRPPAVRPQIDDAPRMSPTFSSESTTAPPSPAKRQVFKPSELELLKRRAQEKRNDPPKDEVKQELGDGGKQVNLVNKSESAEVRTNNPINPLASKTSLSSPTEVAHEIDEVVVPKSQINSPQSSTISSLQPTLNESKLGNLFDALNKGSPRNIASQDASVDRGLTIAEITKGRQVQEEVVAKKAPTTNRPSNLFSAKRNGEDNTMRNANESQPRKVPIRMKLPLEDDLDNEEDGISPSDRSTMSIAEALKKTAHDGSNQEERSKKWGIDMSRFTDN